MLYKPKYSNVSRETFKLNIGVKTQNIVFGNLNQLLYIAIFKIRCFT